MDTICLACGVIDKSDVTAEVHDSEMGYKLHPCREGARSEVVTSEELRNDYNDVLLLLLSCLPYIRRASPEIKDTAIAVLTHVSTTDRPGLKEALHLFEQNSSHPEKGHRHKT